MDRHDQGKAVLLVEAEEGELEYWDQELASEHAVVVAELDLQALESKLYVELDLADMESHEELQLALDEVEEDEVEEDGEEELHQQMETMTSSARSAPCLTPQTRHRRCTHSSVYPRS